MKKIILCDVDLTVVDPIPLWWQWLEIKTGTRISYTELYGKYRRTGEKLPYDVSEIFRDKNPTRMGFDPADFWRNEGIYDLMRPMLDAQDILSKLHSEGYDIRFVSHCKGNHHKSKYEFLERNFPFMTGFAASKEKFMIDCDAFIDDRNDHLNAMGEEEAERGRKPSIKIQHKSPYKQDEPLENGYQDLNWDQIYHVIKREL